MPGSSQFNWWFKPQLPGYRDRNPVTDVFFDSEETSKAVDSVVGALVREGLQNSGDAKPRGAEAPEPVRVRIFVSGQDFALPAEDAAIWADGLWSHLTAHDTGLRKAPERHEECRFVTFEDFGTTGLVGETACDDVSTEPFYCFFRAESSTSKGGNEGGSWGIGKTAFPRASRANALFALSCRQSDERTVLMGSSTMRTHSVDDVKYTPDAWFGVPQAGSADGGVIQPIEDSDLLQQFAEDFGLIRPLAGGIQERAGTSIVVPWAEESITSHQVLLAVIESNFAPIVRGQLVVRIGSTRNPSDDVVLDAGTIGDEVALLERPELEASVRLAQAMGTEGNEEVLLSHEPGSYSVQWNQYSLPDEDRDRLLDRFSDGEPIIVRAPVPMRAKLTGAVHESHLRIALQKFEGKPTSPVFLRGPVVVPDRSIKRVPGAVGLIEAEADELGGLLRAAEDPGHKEWSSSARGTSETWRIATHTHRRTYGSLGLRRNRSSG